MHISSATLAFPMLAQRLCGCICCWSLMCGSIYEFFFNVSKLDWSGVSLSLYLSDFLSFHYKRGPPESLKPLWGQNPQDVLAPLRARPLWEVDPLRGYIPWETNPWKVQTSAGHRPLWELSTWRVCNHMHTHENKHKRERVRVQIHKRSPNRVIEKSI